jgi:two-component system response regulator HydG
MPAGLLDANNLTSSDRPVFRRIISQQGDYYLDAAWPIFEGKAGVLRLGFLESPYRRQVSELWIEIGLFTLGVLLVAWIGSLLFVRRITRPLATLVEATREIDRGAANVQVEVQGHDEIASLASSFNQMVRRQEDYTRRLEEQGLELERAYGQTKAACQIVREISALRTLKEMGRFLQKQLIKTLACDKTVLLLFNTARDALFALDENGLNILKDPDVLKTVRQNIEQSAKVGAEGPGQLKSPVIIGRLLPGGYHSLIPINREPLCGGLLIADATESCLSAEQREWVDLVLKQNAGALHRAVLHEEEMSGLKGRVEAASGFMDLVGKDPKMRVIYKLIEDVAPSDATVLIQGESGTGKELVARAIHLLSPRREAPFVVINCSAYPETLLESELFGHEKGAFTGALRQKAGRFEQAHGGTVFLDEVGDIPLPAQIKLLRVLQTRKFERVGGEQTLTVEVRLLAATHKDLIQEVKNGNFREDLFYRLNVIPINLPPLRERQNDIPLLVAYFLKVFAAEKGRNLQGLSSEALRLLLDYPWPGNVRELENTIEHAVVLAKAGQVEAWDLPAVIQASSPPAPTLAQREGKTLLEILEACGWNKKLAAQRLGISRSTLYLMLKRHKISGSKPTTH